jgi:hypothetical protein
MASRSGSYSVSWFVIGLLAGVALTLAVILVLFGSRAGRREAVDVPVSAAYPARPAHRAQLAPRPAPTPSASQPVDEQTAEDAAAAGMTSRSHANPPPP